MLIYMATNKVNGKSYVGQTIFTLEKRKKQHIYNALNKENVVYFGYAIKKYGPDNFHWIVIHDNITNIDELNQLEIFYIGYYSTFENGYNLTLGGGGMIGYKHNKARLKKISDANKGRKCTTESRRRMSIAAGGKNNHMFGKYHSEESKRKISEASKGNKRYAVAVIINNKHFDTRKEAAEFIRVAPSTVRIRILHKTKWLDYKYA